MATKSKENSKQINNENIENNNINGLTRIKTARPKSSSNAKFENKINSIKNQNNLDHKKNKI